MMTVRELAKIAGVTPRTIQYYDAIGLLPSTERNENGYRKYDESVLPRLFEIMTYKELGFQLEEIRAMTRDPGYDRKAAFEEKIAALERRRDHLNALIGFAEAISFAGVVPIQVQEVGDTPYSEFLARLQEDWNMSRILRQLEAFIREQPDGGDTLVRLYDDLFGMAGSAPPESEEVQAKIENLHEFFQKNLSDRPVSCLRSISMTLAAGGGQADGIRQIYGEAAADFGAEALRIYCDRFESERRLPQKRCFELRQVFKETHEGLFEGE